MSLLNYTPHELTIWDSKKQDVLVRIPVSGKAIRLTQAEQIGATSRKIDQHEVPCVSKPTFIGVTDMPPGEDLSIVVSSLVAEFLSNSESSSKFANIYAPDTSPDGCVRNEKGEIIGTTRLVQYL
jgi:hypothetical protein